MFFWEEEAGSSADYLKVMKKHCTHFFKSSFSSFQSGKILTHRPAMPLGNRKTAVSLDRESIPSQCMDIHRNPRISKWISIKAWIIGE